jgi:hypothetical protein
MLIFGSSSWYKASTKLHKSYTHFTFCFTLSESASADSTSILTSWRVQHTIQVCKTLDEAALICSTPQNAKETSDKTHDAVMEMMLAMSKGVIVYCVSSQCFSIMAIISMCTFSTNAMVLPPFVYLPRVKQRSLSCSYIS